MALPAIPTDFIAHWPGTISGGQLIEETGSHPANIVGTVTRTRGRVGEAANFGQAGRGEATIAGLPNIVTWSAFIYWNGTDSVFIGGHEGTGRGINMSVRSSGQIQCYGWSPGEFLYTRSDATLTPNTVHAIIATLDGNTGSIAAYIDGVETSFTAVTSHGASTQNWSTHTITKVGGWSNSTQYWDGWLNRVRIYPRALAPDEIKSLALERSTIPTTGLVAAYNFADMAAGIVPDSAPGADGTLDFTGTAGVTKSGIKAGIAGDFNGSSSGGAVTLAAMPKAISIHCKKLSDSGVNKALIDIGSYNSSTGYGIFLDAGGADVGKVSIRVNQDLYNHSAINHSLSITEGDHLLAVDRGSSVELYINGVIKHTTAITPGVSTSLNIGQRGDNANGVPHAAIGNIKIYDVEPTPSEIALLATERPATPTLGLVSHWSMDDIQGSTLIDEMGANNGTITGATQVAGQVGQGLSFDGATDRVISSAALPVMPGFAVSFFATAIQAAGLAMLAEISSNSNSVTGGWFLAANGASAGDFSLSFRKVGGGDSISANTAAGLNDGASTYHIVAAYDSAGATVADQLKLYVNGVLQPTATGANTTSVPTAAQPLYLGLRGEGLLYPITGALDEPRIFDQAPDPLDILALANEDIPYAVSGNVLEDGAPVVRTVRAYDAATGALLGETLSDANGEYSIQLDSSADVLVMALGNTGYRPLVHGPVVVN